MRGIRQGIRHAGFWRSAAVLALLLAVAAGAYGFVWWSEVRAATEYREMIYNISKAMGDIPACLD